MPTSIYPLQVGESQVRPEMHGIFIVSDAVKAGPAGKVKQEGKLNNIHNRIDNIEFPLDLSLKMNKIALCSEMAFLYPCPSVRKLWRRR